MYTDAKRRDVHLLLSAGVPRKRIAEVTGVSIRTIRRMARDPAGVAEDAGGQVASTPKPGRSGPGRPSVVDEHRDLVAELLTETPKMKSLEVLRRLRERGYKGGKTAVHERVREVRPRIVRPICRFEGVAGEFTQHDFGQVVVEWTGGERTRVHFFASRLKYSRYSLITPVADQRLETLVRTLATDFERFGGLPLMAVFDRPRTIVTKSDPKTGRAEWNPTFAETMSRLGVAAELCWPYQPQQKGSVENLVGWVKGSFFKTRQFLDEEDLQMQLKAWHEEINERRPSRATGRIPGEMLQDEELERLRPIKLRADELDLRYPVRVSPTGMVSFEKNRYSMPAETLGFSATLHAFAHHIVIRTGDHRVRHPRRRQGARRPRVWKPIGMGCWRP